MQTEQIATMLSQSHTICLLFVATNFWISLVVYYYIQEVE